MPQRPANFPSPITLDDLTADLVWPELLRAGSLAVRPSRVVLGLVWLIGVVAVYAAFNYFDGLSSNVLEDGVRSILLPYGAFIDNVVNGAAGQELGQRAAGAARNLQESFLVAPTAFLMSHPIIALIGVPLLLAWTALFGGAISRSAASDFCLGRSITWPEALGFSIARWPSFLGAILLPLLLLWIIAFGMAVAGLLLRVPGLNVLVGIGWGLFLIGGLIGATIIITYALGHMMLVPAVSCEGTDAIDAVQHAYAYVFARPLRLIVYTFILLLQFIVVAAVIALIINLTARLAGWSAQSFAGERGRSMFIVVARDLNLPSIDGSTAVNLTPTGTESFTIGAIKFWIVLLIGLGIGAGASLYWTSSTMLYLAMRRIVDGQDMYELWTPGLVEGAMAPAGRTEGLGGGVGERTAAARAAVADNDAADET